MKKLLSIFLCGLLLTSNIAYAELGKEVVQYEPYSSQESNSLILAGQSDWITDSISFSINPTQKAKQNFAKAGYTLSGAGLSIHYKKNQKIPVDVKNKVMTNLLGYIGVKSNSNNPYQSLKDNIGYYKNFLLNKMNSSPAFIEYNIEDLMSELTYHNVYLSQLSPNLYKITYSYDPGIDEQGNAGRVSTVEIVSADGKSTNPKYFLLANLREGTRQRLMDDLSEYLRFRETGECGFDENTYVYDLVRDGNNYYVKTSFVTSLVISTVCKVDSYLIDRFLASYKK